MKYNVATDKIKEMLENNGTKHIHVARELEYTPLQWSRVLNGHRRFVNRSLVKAQNVGKSRAERLGEILHVPVNAALELLGHAEI